MVFLSVLGIDKEYLRAVILFSFLLFFPFGSRYFLFVYKLLDPILCCYIEGGKSNWAPTVFHLATVQHLKYLFLPDTEPKFSLFRIAFSCIFLRDILLAALMLKKGKHLFIAIDLW